MLYGMSVLTTALVYMVALAGRPALAATGTALPRAPQEPSGDGSSSFAYLPLAVRRSGGDLQPPPYRATPTPPRANKPDPAVYSSCIRVSRVDRDADGTFDYELHSRYNDRGQEVYAEDNLDGDNRVDFVRVAQYASDGRQLVERVDDDGDGTFDIETTFGYFSTGALANQVVRILATGGVMRIRTWSYRPDGYQLGYEVDYDGDGTRDEWSIFYYSGDGVFLGRDDYRRDRGLVEETRNEISDGLLLRTRWTHYYTPTDRLRMVDVYDYNERRYLVSMQTRDPTTGDVYSGNRYTYDDKTGWVIRIEAHYDPSVVESTLGVEYDDQGRETRRVLDFGTAPGVVAEYIYECE
jgi:hypothetical protein